MYTSLIYIVMCSKETASARFCRSESNTKCQLFQLPDVFLNKCACLVLWSYVFRIGQ